MENEKTADGSEIVSVYPLPENVVARVIKTAHGFTVTRYDLDAQATVPIMRKFAADAPHAADAYARSLARVAPRT